MSRLVNNIGTRILKRKRKNLDRKTEVQNFKTAKSAYIIFDTSMDDSFSIIKDFNKYLNSEKIKCHAIGIVPQKEIPSQMLFWDKYDYITRKEMTLFKKPTGEVADNFFEANPDILFDFTFNAPLEVQYLVQLSKARFKVGCFTEDENDYDLMINSGGDCDLEYFVEQIKRYVNMLNPS
jgi:hypothetical protein